MRKEEKMVVLTVALRPDQLQHIKGIVIEPRDRSRYVRQAIDAQIKRDKKNAEYAKRVKKVTVPVSE